MPPFWFPNFFRIVSISFNFPNSLTPIWGISMLLNSALIVSRFTSSSFWSLSFFLFWDVQLLKKPMSLSILRSLLKTSSFLIKEHPLYPFLYYLSRRKNFESFLQHESPFARLFHCISYLGIPSSNLLDLCGSGLSIVFLFPLNSSFTASAKLILVELIEDNYQSNGDSPIMGARLRSSRYPHRSITAPAKYIKTERRLVSPLGMKWLL